MTKKERLQAAHDHMVATYNAWRDCDDDDVLPSAREEMEIAHEAYCYLLGK